MSIPTTYQKLVVKTKIPDFDKAVELVTVEMPKVESGHVLVRVEYTGIEASDIIQIAGGYGALAGKEPEKEKNGSIQLGDIGCEGVGVVVKSADDVSKYKVGDTVMFWGFGVSFREYVPLSESSPTMWKIPEVAPEYTAVSISGQTAVCGLEMSGRLAAGESVLITAAAGGTGHFAVQWAKHRGCRVAGTCGSQDKEDYLKSLGCDVVINYKTQDVGAVLSKEFPNGVDVIYEAVGGSLRKLCFQHLANFGRMIIVGSVSEDYTKIGQNKPDTFEAGSTMARCVSVVGFFLGTAPFHPRYTELSEQLLDLVATKKIKVKVDSAACQNFVGLEIGAGVHQAQAYMRSGKNVGKIYAKIHHSS